MFPLNKAFLDGKRGILCIETLNEKIQTQINDTVRAEYCICMFIFVYIYNCDDI